VHSAHSRYGLRSLDPHKAAVDEKEFEEGGAGSGLGALGRWRHTKFTHQSNFSIDRQPSQAVDDDDVVATSQTKGEICRGLDILIMALRRVLRWLECDNCSDTSASKSQRGALRDVEL
jgi:hypothetical protein